MTVPAWLLPHRIAVEPYEGQTGAGGPAYGTPTIVRALVAPKARVIRDSEGREVTTTTQIICLPGTVCPPESRITLPDGRITRAVEVADYTAPGLPTPDCVEVTAE